MQRLDTWRASAIVLADDAALHRAGLVNDTGSSDLRRDVGDAAHNTLLAAHATENLVFRDAVLKGDHGGMRADERSNDPRRRFRVPQLHGDQHDVNDTDRPRVVSDGDCGDMNVAERLVLHKEPPLPHRSQVCPPGDERDVAPDVREAAAPDTPNATRTHNGDLHQPEA